MWSPKIKRVAIPLSASKMITGMKNIAFKIATKVTKISNNRLLNAKNFSLELRVKIRSKVIIVENKTNIFFLIHKL